jgi:uncharacterized protein YlxW (UPF0749 family)
MTGGQMMVVLIVAMVMIASIVKAKYQHLQGPRRGRHEHGESGHAIESADAQRLREEVTRLKERVAVLERIATDKNQLLEQEFERLRNS